MNKKIHFLTILTIFCIFLVSFIMGAGVLRAQTEADVQGSAQVLNTSKYLYFTGYNANVKINNTTQEFSGYAWLEGLGWVAFGADDNPDGPVVFSASDGSVSGKATIIDTGNILDFNSSPYSSNVVISSNGSFSGYAWSEDLGWIDFSGVYAPDISFGLPEVGAIIDKINSNLVFYISLLILFITGIIISFILINQFKKKENA